MKRVLIGAIGGAVALSAALVVFASTSGVLLPISDGNYTQWTTSSGATHSTLVDESNCNGTTDYNFTTTVGNRDSYGIDISGVPTAAKITQIDITPCASRNSSGAANPVMNVFYRFDNTDSSDQGSYSLTGTTPIALSTTSFSSLSLFKKTGSSLEMGAVLTSGNRGARLSRIQGFVTYTSLSAPTGLSDTASTSVAGTIDLKWTDNATIEDNYTVERSTDNLNWSQVATTTANKTFYADSGLANGTLYYHRVRAYDVGGFSGYSNVASTTSLDVPTAPSNLNATTATSSINLSWNDNSSNEKNFNVERSLDGINFSHLATTTVNVHTYTDSAVASSTQYYYQVNAYNVAGFSAYTNIASTTSNP